MSKSGIARSYDNCIFSFEGTTILFSFGILWYYLYAGQEATVRTGHGTTDWLQIGKGVCQGCTLSPAYLTSMQSAS